MSRNSLATMAALSAAALLGACEQDGPESEYEDFCPAVLQAVCERRIECYDAEVLPYLGYQDVEQCQALMAPLCAGTAEMVRTSIAADRVRYQASQLGPCLDAYRAAACRDAIREWFPYWPEDDFGIMYANEANQYPWISVSLQLDPFTHQTPTELWDSLWQGVIEAATECAGVLEGQVAEHQLCASWSSECQPGLWCKPDDEGSLTCGSGTCERLAEVGEPCLDKEKVTVLGRCRAGLICNDRTTDGLQRCTWRRQAGDACDSADTGPCDFDLYCDQEQRCQPRQPTGAVCRGQEICAFPNHCVAGYCRMHPLIGEECRSGCWLAYCDTPPDEYTGLCQPLPGPGEPCQEHGILEPSCAEGWCDGESETCMPFIPVGEPCAMDHPGTGNYYPCESGICHPDDLVCVEEYCSEDGDP